MRHRKRASALIGTMCVIAALMAVVMALSYYQGVARQTYMAEEASLRFREGSRFIQRQQILGTAPPGDLTVSASSANVTPANVVQVPNQIAKNIFQRDPGLPDLRALEHGPLHDQLKLTPQTPDVGLRVFGSNTFTTVLTRVPGYAAYAPKGSVNITHLEGWANPTFQDARPSLESFSGVPAVVAALKNATLGNVTYGEAHTIEGQAKIQLGQGLTAKNPQFPLRNYADGLVQQLLTARDQLKANATSSGDKTPQLVSTSTGPEAILNLFFGGGSGLEQFLSLRNANHFWLPMIPSFSPSPPYLYQFAFSLPFPPDNANYQSAEGVAEQLDNIGKQLAQAGKELEDAKKALDQAQQAHVQNPTLETLANLQSAQQAHAQADAKVHDLTQQMQAISGPQSAAVQNQMAAGMKGVPPTRAQDPDGNDGVTGWNYSKAGSLLANLISFMFSFDAKALADNISNDDVKLVHFGAADREFQFVLSEANMTLDATLTVPRGRTLRLSNAGAITISGDLWLQRGSTFVADCPTLKVVPGRGSDVSKFFSPSGRIFLEEGATLICSGDLECTGSSQWGSLIVCGVPGQIHPITAAVFANKVRLSGGIFAGSAIDDLLQVLGKEQAGLKDTMDKLIRPLMSSVGPNAAKALGPFWPRKPYFAKYATTFQIICPPTPLFGAPGPPIPTPIPLPSKNVLVPIAQGLAYVYSVTLNMSLGENFYTHADWWIFGQGVVPIVPQVDPVKALGAIANFGPAAIDALDPKAILTSFVESAVKDMVSYVVEKVIQEVITKVAMQVIPYGGIVSMAADLVGDAVNDLIGREGKRTDAGNSLTSALTNAVANAGKSTLDQLASKFNLQLQDQFLREYNGVLVYAADTLDVGGRNASGMFIAENRLTMAAQHCAGTLLSRNGDIHCSSLLFYPYFNRASLYVPKATPNGWFERALEFEYDQAYASGQAVDVGPPAIPAQISTQGWAR